AKIMSEFVRRYPAMEVALHPASFGPDIAEATPWKSDVRESDDVKVITAGIEPGGGGRLARVLEQGVGVLVGRVEAARARHAQHGRHVLGREIDLVERIGAH